MKNSPLKNWINKHYTDNIVLNSLTKKFRTAKPFPNLELTDFFNRAKLTRIRESLQDEEFYEKESDLFKLKQTNDLVSSKNRNILEFRRFLCSPDFIGLMESIAGTELKQNYMDLSGNIYEDTCFLLCHDDRLEGRKIAFIIYFTSLPATDGGSLGLLDSKKGMPNKIIKRIQPEFNKFAFFQVSYKSFHEVEEVIGSSSRLTLTGWFHGED